MSEEEPKRTHKGQFVKGQSGNPKGRPKGSNWSNHLKEMTEKIGDNGYSDKDLILGKLVELAKKGEPWAIQCVLDRLEGKATQKIEQEITEVPSASVSFKGKGKVTPIPKPDDKATG